VTFKGLCVTYKTGSGLYNWIYWHLLHSHNSGLQEIHRYRSSTHFQFTVAHALGFSVSTSRILATEYKFKSHMKFLHHSLISFFPFLLSHLRLQSPELGPFFDNSVKRLSVCLILRPTFSRPVCLGIKPPSRAYDQIFPLSDHCGFLIWGALSDERTGLSFTMYNIQYILLPQIWDQVPVFISHRNRVARLCPQALGNSNFDLEYSRIRTIP
jgi:hypothetical protein